MATFGYAEDLNRQVQSPWEINGKIKTITIKKRIWRGQIIVQGFQIQTQDGHARACGMSYNDVSDTETFNVPNERNICQIKICASHYIHSLSLVLDNGEVLGKVGENSDLLETIIPSKELSESLCGISGISVRSEKCSAIAKVKFNFEKCK